jgi:hypothetical protein
MNRTTFLTASSIIAFAVAGFALAFPDALLVAKGVTPNAALVVWLREAGVMILASGVSVFLARRAPDSAALRALLLGNAVLHFGLFPIEILAYTQGVIPRLAGVLPNSLVHLLLGVGFVVYARP